jgi:hypothetical protein
MTQSVRMRIPQLCLRAVIALKSAYQADVCAGFVKGKAPLLYIPLELLGTVCALLASHERGEYLGAEIAEREPSLVWHGSLASLNQAADDDE